MKKAFISVVLLVVWVAQSFAAVPPPELRCISVLPNGDVQIDWMPPNDPGGEFDNYEIYASQNGGPYTLLDNGITNRLQNTFVHLGAGISQNNTYSYFFKSAYSVGGGSNASAPSDTVTPIIPNVVTSGRFSGTLTWNDHFSTMPPTIRPNFDIYRFFDNTGGGFNQIGQVPVADPNVYEDSVEKCKDFVNYQVRLPDLTGCVSTSLGIKELLEDVTGPPVVSLDSVSVDNNGRFTILGWPSSQAPDHAGYFIFWKTYDPNGQGTPTIIKSVFRNQTTGMDTTWFIDTALAHSAFLQSQEYSIAPFDRCGNTQGDGGVVHNTIFLQSSTNYCSREALLNWVPYLAWERAGTLVSYKILESVNGGDFKEVGSVGSGVDSFAVQNLKPLDTYTYRIVAQNARGYTSTSNEVSVVFDLVNTPRRTAIRSASVTEENDVEVTCFVDPSEDLPIEEYILTRGYTFDGAYKPVASIENNFRDSVISLTDTSSSPEQGPVYYILEAIDQCDEVFASSGVARTIHLYGNNEQYKYRNVLNWTSYFGWQNYEANVRRYEVHRKLLTDENYEFVENNANYISEYTDDISNVMKSGGQFCYRLRAIQDSGSTFPFIDTAWSNEFCFLTDADIWIPTAFTPDQDGLNDVYRPVVNFISPENGDYSFVVFDRFGQEIWRTDDPSTGWDARGNDGSFFPTGSYVYYIKATSIFGGTTEKRGSFILFR